MSFVSAPVTFINSFPKRETMTKHQSVKKSFVGAKNEHQQNVICYAHWRSDEKQDTNSFQQGSSEHNQRDTVSGGDIANLPYRVGHSSRVSQVLTHDDHMC